MSATLPGRDTHETLELPDSGVPPHVDPDPYVEPDYYVEPDPDTRGRGPAVNPQPPRRGAPIALMVVAAIAVLAAILVILLVLRDTSAEPTPPPATTPPAAAEVPVPATPAPPVPVVVYGTETRANWDVTGVAAGGRLDVFTGPGTHTTILTTLPADLTEMESTGRIARVDGVLWRELVIPGDGTGWINARHLTQTPAPPAPDRVTYGTETPGFFDVTGVSPSDTLNVRTGPGTTHPVIATLAHDATRLESTGRTARVNGAPWREIALPGDGQGWVSAAFLTPSPATPQIVYGQEPRANWDVTGITAGAVLNVHRAPGAFTPVVAYLASDAAELESTGRIARVDGALWRELVVPGDGTGWVDAANLTETSPPPTVVYGQEPPATWDVTDVPVGDTLNVRTGPGAHNPVLTTLPRDATQLASTGRIAHVDGVLWRELVIADDATGWVNATYLTEAPPPPTDAPA